MKIEYEHPLLEPICRETYGIMVYQEQVMQAAQVLAGYTLGGADLLRRAMGKKKVEEMAKQRDIFVKGCAKMNNIPAAKANQIFDLLEKFAGYGFNKSHAAAYAIVAYQTAYLKANYPVEFFCAMMTNDMADTDKLSQYIAEARGMGIEVLPPDVNESQVYFAPAPRASPATAADPANGRRRCGTQAIRFGLAAIKGVGEVAVEAILKARDEGGQFQSLADMCERVDGRSVNRKVLEALIKSGACDCFGQTRATLFAQIDRTLARAASIIADRQRGQSFAVRRAGRPAAPRCRKPQPNLPEWPRARAARARKGAARLLRHRPSADALRADAGEILPGQHRHAGAVAEPQPDPHRRHDRRRAERHLQEERQALRHGHAGGPGRLGADALHERELRQVSRAARAGQSHPGRRRSQHRRRQAEDLSRRKSCRWRTRRGVTPSRSTCACTPPTSSPSTSSRSRNWSPRIRASARCSSASCGPTGEVVFVETHEKFFVAPSRALQQAADELFGEDTYYAKVDTSLPERAPRRWERRADNGDAEYGVSSRLSRVRSCQSGQCRTVARHSMSAARESPKAFV